MWSADRGLVPTGAHLVGSRVTVGQCRVRVPGRVKGRFAVTIRPESERRPESEQEAVVSAIKANEEPVEGEYACSNDTIVEVTGLDSGRVADILGRLWKRGPDRGRALDGRSPALPLRHPTGDARATAALGCRRPLQVAAVAPSSGEVELEGYLRWFPAAVSLIVTRDGTNAGSGVPPRTTGRETRARQDRRARVSRPPPDHLERHLSVSETTPGDGCRLHKRSGSMPGARRCRRTP